METLSLSLGLSMLRPGGCVSVVAELKYELNKRVSIYRLKVVAVLPGFLGAACWFLPVVRLRQALSEQKCQNSAFLRCKRCFTVLALRHIRNTC